MIAAVLSAALASSSPCGPLNLPTTLSLSRLRSDEVAIKNAEVLAAQADRAIARAIGILPGSSATVIAGPAPSAHGNQIQSLETNRSLRNFEPFIRTEVSLFQPLWTWGQLTAAKSAAEAGVRGKTLLVEDTAHQVEARVLQLYWGAALARRLLGLAGEVEGALRDVEKRIAESLAAGDGQVTQEDKFRVAVFRGELEQRRSEAQKGLQLARIGIAATLAIDEGDLQLEDEGLPSQLDLKVPDRNAAWQDAESLRPDLLALDQGIAALEAQAKAARAAELPQVFAAGTFTYSYAGNRDIQTNAWINDYFNTLSIGIGLVARQNLSFPTLSAQAQKMDAELAIARRQRQGLVRLVRAQVEQSIAELTSASAKARAAQASVSAGRSWFRTAGLNFGIGVTDAKALMESYTGYIKTQLDSAQATYDLLLAKGRMDQLTGKALSKGESTCALQ